ncbi:MAG: transposase, partial [Candidatus Helarchaeota archaeon]
ANVHDSVMLQPLTETIESNLPDQKIEKMTGDKAYESNSAKEFLKGRKAINEIISKEEPKTTAEIRKKKKLNSKRSMIETIYGISTTKLGLEQSRVRGIEAINFNTALLILIQHWFFWHCSL